MARTHRAYPPELRQQTVELVQSGRTPDELARRYELLEQIKTIWQSNREAYGRPRIHTEPLPAGERVSPKRVGRLMRRAGIEGAGRPRSTKTSTGDERAARAVPDLVDRVPVGGAPTHEPCTGQEIVQAKARASARHT
jgi:transposase InsO family protein